MKKITVIIISFIFLSACTQSTVFLGPAISVGTSGNVMQAGYSYGTNMAVKQTTGKMASEHVSLYIEKEKEKTYGAGLSAAVSPGLWPLAC